MNLKTSTIKNLARRQALRRNTVTIYVPVTNNIYYDGLSYRVRVTRNTERTSKNFPSKLLAVKYRNELLGR